MTLPARLWFRGKYLLSILVLLLPLTAFPDYFVAVEAPPLGLNILPERMVGPFPVTLAEFMPGPPRIGPRRHLLKDYALSIREGYPDRIRSVYIRVGKPPNSRNLGEFMHGTPYRLHAELRFVTPPRADDTLWLTLEEWDGTLHQTHWPLPEVMTEAGLDQPPNNSAAR